MVIPVALWFALFGASNSNFKMRFYLLLHFSFVSIVQKKFYVFILINLERKREKQKDIYIYISYIHAE